MGCGYAFGMVERLPRWSYLVLSFIGGALLAPVLTGIHQSSFSVGGVNAPWGIFVAMIVISAYFIAVRLLAATRWPVIFAALGAILTIGLFSLQGPGGSLLIVGNLQGLVWAYGPVIIAAIVIMWPKLPDKDETNGRRLRTSEAIK